METVTIVLLIAIGIFIIGNYLLAWFIRREKQKKMFHSDATESKVHVLKSKVEVLNNRLSRIEGRK